MSTSTIKHQNAQLSVTDIGQGRAVTFLHAGVADRRSWGAVMDIVATSYRAIAYDQRGYGETVYESEPYSHTSDLMAVLDARIIADVARRLRGEEPLTTYPPQPLPGHRPAPQPDAGPGMVIRARPHTCSCPDAPRGRAG